MGAVDAGFPSTRIKMAAAPIVGLNSWRPQLEREAMHQEGQARRALLGLRGLRLQGVCITMEFELDDIAALMRLKAARDFPTEKKSTRATVELSDNCRVQLLENAPALNKWKKEHPK